MKRATVYRRGIAIIVHASSCSTDGVWFLTEPCLRLASDCSDRALGDAVLAALEGSRSPLPHPTHWRGVLAPLLKAAGVSTWTAFATGAVGVGIEAQDGHVGCVPLVNLGAADGFEEDVSRRLDVALASGATVLGATVREALGAAR